WRGVPLELTALVGRRVFDPSEPERAISLAEAVQRAEAKGGTVGTVGSYRPPKGPGHYKGAGVGPLPSYSYSAAVIEVAVDEPTGMVRVEKVCIGIGIRRAINLVLVGGQWGGSVYWVLGGAVFGGQAVG